MISINDSCCDFPTCTPRAGCPRAGLSGRRVDNVASGPLGKAAGPPGPGGVTPSPPSRLPSDALSGPRSQGHSRGVKASRRKYRPSCRSLSSALANAELGLAHVLTLAGPPAGGPGSHGGGGAGRLTSHPGRPPSHSGVPSSAGPPAPFPAWGGGPPRPRCEWGPCSLWHPKPLVTAAEAARQGPPRDSLTALSGLGDTCHITLLNRPGGLCRGLYCPAGLLRSAISLGRRPGGLS